MHRYVLMRTQTCTLRTLHHYRGVAVNIRPTAAVLGYRRKQLSPSLQIPTEVFHLQNNPVTAVIPRLLGIVAIPTRRRAALHRARFASVCSGQYAAGAD